jgi:DNA replication and repair protein RecF
LSEAAIRIEEAPAPARHDAAARFRRIALADFRSYDRTDIALDGRPAVFAGPNGAGKTNLLEALSLLGPGRGLRGARLDELPRKGGAGGWAVSATLEADGDLRPMGVGASAGSPNRRACRIDQAAASGPTAFCDHVRFVWLTPAQDRLFTDSAGERRRFFDRMTAARDPALARAARDYERAMRQRQSLLNEGARDAGWLRALELQMAQCGTAIAAARRETAAALAAAEVADADGTFPAADLALKGEIEAALERAPAADVEEAFAARLAESRRADAEAGRALAGPHRSDVVVSHRGKEIPARLCSTGEQKALLVGLVLANARALAPGRRFSGAGAPLVLLLDEIGAHFDADRRAALFSILDGLGFQVFMTGTDQSLFSAWRGRAQGFAADAGRIREIDLG